MAQAQAQAQLQLPKKLGSRTNAISSFLLSICSVSSGTSPPICQALMSALATVCLRSTEANRLQISSPGFRRWRRILIATLGHNHSLTLSHTLSPSLSSCSLAHLSDTSHTFAGPAVQEQSVCVHVLEKGSRRRKARYARHARTFFFVSTHARTITSNNSSSNSSSTQQTLSTPTHARSTAIGSSSCLAFPPTPSHKCPFYSPPPFYSPEHS